MASPTLTLNRKKSVLSGVIDVHRLSRPQLSWFILTATAFVIALVLLIWLLLWISRPRGNMDGWWVAQHGLATPVVGHQSDDVRLLAQRARREIGYQSLEETLRNHLAAAGTRPVVVYVSAAGVADDQGAFFLRPEAASLQTYAASGARQTLLTAERLIDLCNEFPSHKKLIILDAGQVGSDRNIGIFGNSFAQSLRTALEAKKPKGLAILCANGPGQTSWPSEVDRRSVFGHYVARGLTGKASGWDPSTRGLTVRALRNYVRYNVSRWVAANRQAEQTPELLGDPSLNFSLRQTSAARVASPTLDEKGVEQLFARLDEGWARRDDLQKRKPFRHTPLLWQQYQETLLRAERLLRIGEYGEAEESLSNLPGLGKKIADGAGGPPLESPWSLALLERVLAEAASEAGRKELQIANENIDAAFKELTVGTEEAAEAPAAEPTEVEPVAEPAAKPGEPVKSVPSARKPKAAAAPAKPKPKGVSSLSALLARDDVRPAYVESQLLLWVGAFAKRSGAPYSFKGTRGDLLFEALQARRLAEQAAASDERISRWVGPIVEAGDALRRRAQDGLFAGDVGQFEGLSGLLEQARGRYREALEAADGCARAVDLLSQLESELPFYGEWKARRGARRDDGLDKDFLDLMASASALARRIYADLPEPRDGDEALAPHLDLIQKLQTQYRETRAAFERVRADFQVQTASLAASGAGRWREMDAVLNVPLIPAETRKALLMRVRSATVAGTLMGSEGAPPLPGDLNALAKSQVEKSAVPRKPDARDDGAEVVAAGEVASAPDPDFWKQALGLARLEWGMMEIGGASETDLSRLEDAFEAARGAVKREPASALAALNKLSELIRALRADRVKALQQVRAQTYPLLADADRAARVLPLVDSLGLSDKAAETLDQFHRQALLVWHGRRLVQDFAPNHALRLFEKARQAMETDAVRIAGDEAVAVGRARLAMNAEPDETITIKEWAEQPLSIGVTAVGSVPRGDAALFVGYDAAQPLTVTRKAGPQNAREGVLVPVRPEKSSGRVDYSVGRTESNRQAILAGLTPSAFYRGRFFAGERALQVALEPAKDPVAITIEQSYEGLKFKDFTDQFKEHPGQGYLHYGTNLQYKLALKSDRPVKVVVKYGLKEHPESFKTKTVEIIPKKRGEVIDVIKGNDFPIVKAADDLLNVAPLNLMVTVWKDKENGELQGRAHYTFQMIPPSRYIATSSFYDPATRIVAIYVTHLANDPVTGPVEIIAAIGGNEIPGVIRRSRIGQFFFRIPLGLKKIRWRVGIESMPAAFSDEIDTPPPAGMEAPAAPPPAQ